jgi:hypothetical protein
MTATIEDELTKYLRNEANRVMVHDTLDDIEDGVTILSVVGQPKRRNLALPILATAASLAALVGMATIRSGRPPTGSARPAAEVVTTTVPVPVQSAIFPPSDPAPTQGQLPRFNETPTESAESVRARLSKMHSLKGAVELGATCDSASFADWETSPSGVFPLAWGIDGTCRFIGWQLTSEWRPSRALSDGLVQRAFVYGDDGVAFAAMPLPDPLPADFPLPAKVKLAVGSGATTPVSSLRVPLPAGAVLQGAVPSCTTIDNVEFRCTFEKYPGAALSTPERQVTLGQTEPIVDDTSHVSGGCRALSEDGVFWTCFVGQMAIDEGTIGANYLGATSPRGYVSG